MFGLRLFFAFVLCFSAWRWLRALGKHIALLPYFHIAFNIKLLLDGYCKWE